MISSPCFSSKFGAMQLDYNRKIWHLRMCKAIVSYDVLSCSEDSIGHIQYQSLTDSMKFLDSE